MEQSLHQEDRVKIIFHLPDKLGKPDGTESLWGVKVGKGKYQIKNVPFFTYDISYNDIVNAKEIDNNIVEFQSVYKRGGHSTYRVLLCEGASESEFKKYWKEIEKLEGTFEKATKSLYGIDLSPKVDVHKVYKILEEGEKKKVWHFEEGHYGYNQIN